MAFELDRTRRGGRHAERPLPAAAGLMPGRYFIAALPRDRLNGRALDAAFFEQSSKEATSIVIGEDENRQADLKLIGGGGGM